MNEANTIWVKAYTPAGHQVGITLGFEHFESGKLPSAEDVDRLVAEKGYTVALAGMEPGEETEAITHVMRRTQHNSDGTTTACIGFYHENPKLLFAYHRFYVNTDADRQAFEEAAGVKIDAIPLYTSDQFPLQNSPNAQPFLHSLPKPMQIVTKQEPYTKKDGTSGTAARFQRFASQAPASKSDKPAQPEQAQDDVPQAPEPAHENLDTFFGEPTAPNGEADTTPKTAFVEAWENVKHGKKWASHEIFYAFLFKLKKAGLIDDSMTGGRVGSIAIAEYGNPDLPTASGQ